jgi:hypothetical protein
MSGSKARRAGPSCSARPRLWQERGARASGRPWWTERGDPKGWRCLTCHPPDHLPAEILRRKGRERSRRPAHHTQTPIRCDSRAARYIRSAAARRARLGLCREQGLSMHGVAARPAAACHNRVYRNARITRSRRSRDAGSTQSRGPNGVFCAGSATPLARAPGCVTASDIRCRFPVGVCRKRATMRDVHLAIGGEDGAIRWHQISTAMVRGPQDAYALCVSLNNNHCVVN